MFQRMQHKHGNMAMYLALLFAAVVVMVGIKECSVESLPQRPEMIAGGDTINVAIELSPMGVTAEGDSLGGYYYKLMRRIAERNHRAVRFHPFTLVETALQGLDSGKYQVVISDIPITQELRQKYIFVEPGEIDRQVLVQRRDSAGRLAYSSQFELAGAHITMPKNSPYISRLYNLSHEIGDTIFVDEDEHYSSEQLIVMTALGEVPAVVVSAHMAEPLLKRYPNLDGSLFISFNQFHGWAMLPADSLLRNTLALWIEHDADFR